MSFTGPLEFSTGDIVIGLLLLALYMLVPLVVGAALGVAFYRVRVPAERRSRSGWPGAAGFGALGGILLARVVEMALALGNYPFMEPRKKALLSEGLSRY